MENIISNPPTHHVFHIAFLHPRLGRGEDDRYIVDLAIGLQNTGHYCSIFTAEFDEDNPLDAVHPIKGSIEVIFSGKWIPSSICGFFKRTMARIKAVWIALRIIINPPSPPKPKLVVADSESLVLPILTWFSHYKTLYVHDFSQLYKCHEFFPTMHITSDLITLKSMNYANAVIVQTDSLAEIYTRSFPKVNKDVCVVYPRYDTGPWSEEVIDIRRILPDLPNKFSLFVCFGEYRRRSNFKLVLRAMEWAFNSASWEERSKIHLVIGGHCSVNSTEQQLYYEELIHETKHKRFASQLTFLKQLPTVHKKTLIQMSTAVIHSVRHDVFPGPILAAMSIGKPIIALNCGFASKVLMHRLTAILIDPDPIILGRVMFKLTTSETLVSFLSEMAYNTYQQTYGYRHYCEALNELVQTIVLEKSGLLQ